MRLFRYFIISTLLTSATPTLASQPAHKISAGITLYNQLKLDAAFPVLEKEARSGNVESQYYLGEALRKRNRYMTPEAQYWYETAAMNGSKYAMIQLGRSGNDLCKTMSNCPETEQTSSDWLRNVETLAKPKAEQGDEEAMYIMYEVTLNRD